MLALAFKAFIGHVRSLETREIVKMHWRMIFRPPFIFLFYFLKMKCLQCATQQSYLALSVALKKCTEEKMRLFHHDFQD